MRNKILNYIKTSISPIKLLEISKELEIDFKAVKECVTQLENESLVFKHSNRGYLSTPERIKEEKQAKVSTSKENAPKKPKQPSKAQQVKEPKQPSKAQQVKELKEKISRPRQSREEYARKKSAYDKTRRGRKLLRGETESNKLAKIPTRNFSFIGDVMVSDDMAYFAIDKGMSVHKGSYTCMKIADLERLLTIVKELQK